MYRRFVLASAVAIALSLAASAQQKTTNLLLSQEFWRSKPTLETLQAEIARGNSPTESNSRTMDVVTIAIQSDAPLALIDHLLAIEGNSVSKQTHHYRTYLHWAAARGRVELVERLIALGADVNALDEHGNTPLMYALGNGVTDTTLIEVMERAGHALTKRHPHSGATLMMLAIGSDKELRLADYLSTRGLSLLDVDARGATLVDYACRSGHVAQLRTLMTRGIKPTEQALLMAAQGTRRSANGIELYRFLVEELGLSPLVRDAEGNTLLHLVATKAGQLPVVEYLTARGVKPEVQNAEGNTAFMLSAGGRDLTLTQYLRAGADLSQANRKGETALTRAIQSGSPEHVAYLIAEGADARVLDAGGRNLLYHLAQNYREPMPAPQGAQPQQRQGGQSDFLAKVRLLADSGLPVTTPQPDGSTLYHYAAGRGSVAMLEEVAGLGLDINTVNAEGLTPLHRAALTARDTTILKRLLELGADPGVRTDLDETAYDLARENGYLSKLNADISFLK